MNENTIPIARAESLKTARGFPLEGPEAREGGPDSQGNYVINYVIKQVFFQAQLFRSHTAVASFSAFTLL